VVNVKLQLHFGDEQKLRDRKDAAALAGGMLMRGTQRDTRQQISDEFDRLRAEVAIAGGAEGASASITTIRENLPAVLQLVAECLQKTSFPADEFNSLKRETQAAIESQRREPQAIAINEIQQVFNVYSKEDPRYIGSFDEQLANLAKVNLEDAKRFYTEFY